MKLAIGYVTARTEPHVEWMLDSLALQARPDDEIELLLIDLHFWDRAGRDERDARRSVGFLSASEIDELPWLTRIAGGAPKPTIWQGPHRITSCDWWAKANAINTALVLATYDYIAFVDDRCHLGPDWLETVRRGERERASVLCGSYDRHEDGRVTADGRRMASPTGRINCGGTWLYGCTYALPLEWALEVNGAEEGTDGLGAEDYIFGLNLQHAGRRLDFAPSLFVQLERSAAASSGLHGHAISPAPKRSDKGVSPNDKSHAALRRFGARKRTEFTPDLRELRARAARGEPFPVPDPAGDHRDWYDSQPIREM